MSSAPAIAEEDRDPPVTRGTFRRLLPFLGPHRRTLKTAVLTVTTVAACQLAGPLILAWVINEGIESARAPVILLGVAGALAAYLVGAAVGYRQTVMLSRMGLRIVTEMKSRVFAHLLSLGTRYHDRTAVGTLIARTESDAETVKELFSSTAVQIAQNVITFAGALGVMLVMRFRVAVSLLVLVPLLALASAWFLRMIRRVYREVRRRYADLSGTVTEYVQGVPVVQHYDQRERALRLLDEKNRAKYRVEMKAWVLDYSFWGAFGFAEVLAMAAILTIGSPLIVERTMEVGTIILFLEYTRRVFEPILALGEQLNQVQRALASADRVFEVLAIGPDVRDRPDAATAVDFERTLVFEDVSFRYDDDHDVLSGLSFTLRRGEKLALVGPSGGGKTTLVGLLCRFLDPTGGRILVDGRDLREFTQKAWRDRVGLVLQEIYLFPGTVLDNLRVLDDRIPADAARRAAAAVTADAFLARQPDGYDTDLAERGGNLSLGERQLLSFARALTFDPDLLILDEATSSVDPETEARIQESLGRLLAGRTAVIVAHRLQTIRDVDRILVLKDGRVVEEGDHETLYAAAGLYRQLWDLQATGNGRAVRR